MRIEAQPYERQLGPSEEIPTSRSLAEEKRRPLPTAKKGHLWGALKEVGGVMVDISTKIMDAELLEERNRLGVELATEMKQMASALETDPNVKELTTRQLLDEWSNRSQKVRDKITGKATHSEIRESLSNDWALKDSDANVHFTTIGWNNQANKTKAAIEGKIRQSAVDFVEFGNETALQDLYGAIQSGVGVLYDSKTAETMLYETQNKIKEERYQRMFITHIRDSENFIPNHKILTDAIKSDGDLDKSIQSKLLHQLQTAYYEKERRDHEWVQKDWSTSVSYVLHAGAELPGVRSMIKIKLGEEGLKRYDADVNLARRKWSEQEAVEKNLELTRLMTDSVASARYTGIPISGLEQLILAHGGKHADQKLKIYKDELKLNLRLHDVEKAIIKAAPEDARKIFETAAKATPGKPGFADEWRFQELAEGMLAKKYTDLVKDPAGYVVNEVKIFQETMSLDENKNLIYRDATGANIMEKNIDARISEQRRQGLKDNQITALTKKELDTVKDRIDGLSGENLLGYITQIKDLYGNHYPLVYDQLVGAGVGGTYELIEYAEDEALAIRIANLSKKPAKEYKEILGGDSSSELKDLRILIDAHMENYTKAVASLGGSAGVGIGLNPDATERLVRLKQSLMHVGMAYMVEGKNSKEAAKLATNIVNDGYYYQGTYTIPRRLKVGDTTVYLNEALINAMLGAYMDNTFPNEELFGADYISKEYHRLNAFWADNKSGDGVILTSDKGFPIRRKKGEVGEVIELKFIDLNKAELIYSAEQQFMVRDPMSARFAKDLGLSPSNIFYTKE